MHGRVASPRRGPVPPAAACRRPAAARDERGFTLIELLVSATVGTLVLLAVFGLLDVSFKHYARIDDRVDAVQRGRQAMETITQQLRAQVCLGPSQPAVVKGDDEQVWFVADLGDESFDPQQHRLIYTPASGSTPGYMTEQIFNDPNAAAGATPDRTRWLIDGIVQEKDSNGNSIPVFRYYAFTPDPVTPDLLQATPLITDDPNSTAPNNGARTVKMAVGFTVKPRHRQPDTVAANFDNYVYIRTADPTDPQRSPLCL